MPLLFFHGDEILGFFAGIAIGCVAWVAILYGVAVRPSRYPLVPAIIYLLIASIPSMLLLFSDGLNLLQLMVVWIVSFPWIIIFIVLTTFYDVDIGNSVALIGAILNAILFYVVGKTVRWRLDRRSAHSPPTDV